jgi:hypothetical protein
VRLGSEAEQLPGQTVNPGGFPRIGNTSKRNLKLIAEKGAEIDGGDCSRIAFRGGAGYRRSWALSVRSGCVQRWTSEVLHAEIGQLHRGVKRSSSRSFPSVVIFRMPVSAQSDLTRINENGLFLLIEFQQVSVMHRPCPWITRPV